MKYHRITFLLLTLLLSCSDRERLNPLDPSNPYTDGAPTGVWLYSQQDAVFLRWSPMIVDDLKSYIIYRATDLEKLAAYDSLPASTTEFIDLQVNYDTRYSYAVQAVTVHDNSKLSDTLSIVPGPYDLVVADYYSQRVSRLSYDCSRQFEIYDNFTPTDMIIVYDKIYFSNLWDNSLKIIDLNGNIQSVPLEEAPVDIAYDDVHGLIYVLTRDNNSLFTISADGQNRGRHSLGMDVHFHTTVSFDPVRDCLWITDDFFDKIYRYNLSGHFLISISDDIVGPDEVIVDKANGGCWAASKNGIIHIDSNDDITQYMTNYSIYDLSQDKRTGDLYYSGLNNDTNRWEIGFFAAGEKTELYTSYTYIYKLQVIQETKGVGLALYDSYEATVIRLNAEGEEIGRRFGVYGVMAMDFQ